LIYRFLSRLLEQELNTQAPSYIKTGAQTVNIGSEKKDFGSESVYDKESNSIQYTTVAKFPPVKLLPNAERKRILSES
jgi:UDP-glucuronate decarboxylase